MSKLKKVVFIFLLSSLFFSESTGKAFLYSCCLLKFFNRSHFTLLFGVISVIFDIYYSQFIGLTFLSLSIVVITMEKFEEILKNLNVGVRLYYLFVVICGAELINCLLIVLINGRVNFSSHFFVVMKSIFFCYVFESLEEHVKRS